MPETRSLVFLGLCSVAGVAMAQLPAQTPSVYLQRDVASRGTHALTLGATLPWGAWQKPLGPGVLSGFWDTYVSRWSYGGSGGRDHLWLLGLTPTLRWTPGEGRSPWFFQAGIGITLSDHLYRSADEQFSTAFNFASHLGVGLRFGQARRQEVVLRVQHLSNASIKSPNPGINYVQMRYGYHW
ncbi:MAG: acyloxyacyl hydrolase [Simplicispira suum]|uniref:acyloxyacyl hydrolase n=1 Tax=Simplicispira suum TaxID=2109915 RepID=UPI001C6B3CCD|nr:acyloxyacyl hydrolase [Simplicispira suum]MBW7835000.1 acyloxyacyl hydrolase [Simplicispira suum]